MTRHIPLPPPSQATLDARAAAEALAARAGGVRPNIGQLWTRKSDGLLFRIAGAKGGAVITWGLIDEEDNVVMVGSTELVDDYAHAGCDHDFACCSVHNTHTMPHKGCILR